MNLTSGNSRENSTFQAGPEKILICNCRKTVLRIQFFFHPLGVRIQYQISCTYLKAYHHVLVDAGFTVLFAEHVHFKYDVVCCSVQFKLFQIQYFILNVKIDKFLSG